MVSLEKRLEYQFRILKNQKLTAFNDLLAVKSLKLPTANPDESDGVYFGLINAIQSNDKSAFETHFNKKSKSHPNKDSLTPFVNDDFLIFCLVLGILKFGLEKKWIKEIVSLRNRSSITITFDNILNEDFLSNSNLPEIVLVFLKLFNLALINNDLLNRAYDNINQNVTLFESKNDFQIICAINAENLIINLKVAPTGSEICLLKNFNSKFLKRVKIFSWFTQTIIFIFSLFLLVRILSYVPSIKGFFDKYNPIFTLLSILGISLLGNFIPVFKIKIYNFLLRIFGYPKELRRDVITKAKNKEK
jgi:hypothetical protein